MGADDGTGSYFHSAGCSVIGRPLQNDKSKATLPETTADCSNATVNVSFQTWDKPCDWKIIYNTESMKFQAIVNLKSEHLAIPATKGQS